MHGLLGEQARRSLMKMHPWQGPQATPRGTNLKERSDRMRAVSSGPAGSVLIVDADSGAASAVAEVFARDGHRVELAMDLRGVDVDAFDVVVVAVVEGAGEPADIVDLVRPPGRPGAVELIVLSTRHDVDAAVAALHRGASDFLVKPVSPSRLRLALGRALERRRLLRENARLQRDLALFAIAQRLLEHLDPAELAIAGVDALCSAGGATAAALWGRDVRAARGLSVDEANAVCDRLAPTGFVEHHTGDAVGLPRLAVVLLLDLGADLSVALGFDDSPGPLQQEGLFFLARQLGTAFQNAARYRDAADLAMRDALTGLWNASAFSSALQRLVDTGATPFCLLFLDLDRFKLVNDRFGHLVGSRAIVEAAHTVEAQVREGDIVGRYGGDELVVLLPAADGAAGFIVAERIRRAIEATRVGGVDDLRLTVSVGVAASPDDGVDSQTIFEAADRGLYLAKGANRNQVCRAAAVPRPLFKTGH
jgi:diguanylate cyclase (GGDEF)-like protein